MLVFDTREPLHVSGETLELAQGEPGGIARGAKDRGQPCLCFLGLRSGVDVLHVPLAELVGHDPDQRQPERGSGTRELGEPGLQRPTAGVEGCHPGSEPLRVDLAPSKSPPQELLLLRKPLAGHPRRLKATQEPTKRPLLARNLLARLLGGGADP